jgi:transposase
MMGWTGAPGELMRHRARELLAGQRTAALNALRGHLAEIGLIAPQGTHHAYGLKRMAADGFNENGEIVVPDCVRGALRSLSAKSTRSMRPSERSTGSLRRRSRRTRRPSG